jgi:hypothetical protein
MAGLSIDGAAALLEELSTEALHMAATPGPDGTVKLDALRRGGVALESVYLHLPVETTAIENYAKQAKLSLGVA